VVDLSYQQNPAQAVSNLNAMPASGYVNNVAPPEVQAFDLDFNANPMMLMFIEPVLVSSVSLGKQTGDSFTQLH